MNKVLIIAVHPDDETLGCGGTILKHKSNGDEIYWLILTQANQNITNIPEIVNKQSIYINEVAENYNFDDWKQLNFLTITLDQYPTMNIVKDISNYINLVRPNIIYFHHFADVHTDHKIAFDAIYSCTKNFRYPFISKILLFETLSETEFSPSIRNNAFIPNVFIDITPYLEKKLEIMKIYKTEIMDEPYPRSISTIEALARFRGSRIGVKYAESFMLLYEKA